MQVTSWNALETQRISSNVTRKMFWGEKIMVARVELAPHASVPLHNHESEQVTIVERGSLTISFDGGRAVKLIEGDMIVVPGAAPHGALTGPEGCTTLEIFSPVRQDYIDSTSTPSEAAAVSDDHSAEDVAALDEEGKYRRLQGFLQATGITIELEELKKVPLELLARYVYDKQCITLGELRKVLGLDKMQAKALLREWKHGDDHSESSLKRNMERQVVFPAEWPSFFKE
jgi:quercetin dioxygenase-like cupin family protein